MRKSKAKRKQSTPQKTIIRREYAAAQGGRLTSDWMAAGTSQDSELYSSLATLRNRSRQMIRDNPHAANLRRIIQDNVVGTGIGIQCQILDRDGQSNDRLNNQIEEAWKEWSEKETCHTAGQLCLSDLLRLVIGAVFQDGEAFIRKVPMAFGGGKIPLALEIIEPDLIFDQGVSIYRSRNHTVRLGVEVDEWNRPVAYWMHRAHPGDMSYVAQSVTGAGLRRIPADEIEHLFLIERWPQTRGTPWMHSVLRRMRDMGGYTESELVAARASANVLGFIERTDMTPDEIQEDPRKREQTIASEPGEIRRLYGGETFTGFAPSRPNSNLDPFMRYMLREVAAGVGVSYESLSRDYSQSNYSSSRLALLDDRNLWRVLQGWLIRNYLTPIYRTWLDAAVLSGVLDIPDYFSNKKRYQAVRFKPRGWSWVDPQKEVQAYALAVANGFMSRSDVIAAIGNGQDREDVDKAIKRDQDGAAALGLKFDSVVKQSSPDTKADDTNASNSGQ